MQSDNFTDELKARGATLPNPIYHVYDFNAAVGGPIVKDKLWYYMSVRAAGAAAEHAERLLQPERGRRERVHLRARSQQAGVFGSHVGELHAAHHLAGVAAQQVHVLVGRTAGLPHLHRHDVAHRLAELRLPDVAGSRRPRRVQPAARPEGALDVAGDQQAAPRSRVRHHVLPVGRPRARSEPDARSGAGR